MNARLFRKHVSEYSVHGLKLQARETAHWLRHALGPWEPNAYYGKRYFHAACPHCGMAVTVTANPQANETFISGSAIAVNCTRWTHTHDPNVETACADSY